MLNCEWIVCMLVVVSPCLVPRSGRAQEEPPAELLWPAEITAADPLHSQEEIVINHEHTRNEFDLNRSHRFVSAPTLSLHLPPEDVKTDVAVIVCPGGGYNEIWIDWEGHDIARRLTPHGIMVAVLKYRTRPQTTPWPEFMPVVSTDAARAVRILRSRAQELGIDANKIGILGFSAGGHLAATLTVSHKQIKGNNDDPIDDASARPNFVTLLYPGLFEDILRNVNSTFPPTLIIHARNDDIAPVTASLQMYAALLRNLRSYDHSSENKPSRSSETLKVLSFPVKFLVDGRGGGWPLSCSLRTRSRQSCMSLPKAVTDFRWDEKPVEASRSGPIYLSNGWATSECFRSRLLKKDSIEKLCHLLPWC